MPEEGSPALSERIRVQSDSDMVAIAQLAARWSELFRPAAGDTSAAALRRFRAAYEYLDAVTHGLEPRLDL